VGWGLGGSNSNDHIKNHPMSKPPPIFSVLPRQTGHNVSSKSKVMD